MVLSRIDDNHNHKYSAAFRFGLENHLPFRIRASRLRVTMHVSVLSCLLFLAIPFPSHILANVIEKKDVFEVDETSFDDFVKSKELVMVEFYAPWCGHCKKLEPEYEKAAAKLKAKNLSLSKVDASAFPQLAKRFAIEGFPTLILFKNGEPAQKYDGERNAGAIVTFMLQMNDPDWKPPPSPLVTLTAENFTKFVKNENVALVLFYAPWHKECKAILPEYEEAAVELKEWGIPLIKVDGTREKELADQYNADTWPTFRLFRQGRAYDYIGPMNKEEMIGYMKEQEKPPSEEKTSLAGLTSSMERTEVTIIGFFNKNSDIYHEFIVATNEMRGAFKFMHTFDPEIAKVMEAPMDSVGVFLPEIFWSPYDNKTSLLSKKSANHMDIVTFVRKQSVPLVGWRTKKNIFKYTTRPLIVAYFDVNFDHQFVKDTQFIRKKIIDVAKKYTTSNLKFAISNEAEFEDEIASLGFVDNGEDVSIACFTEKQKFRMEPDGEFEPSQLEDFVDKLKAGKIQPYMRSMPVPKKQENLPVRKIVANNYDTEIHKVKKDAVLFIFSPECKHCKKFDPTFTKIAKKMTSINENIIFGKLDGTSNDIPYMFPPVSGYPTIYFISAYSKFEPVVYKGDYGYKSLKDWINRHTSIFLSEDESMGKASASNAEIDDEIESFTAESFEADIVKHHKKDEL